MPVTTPAPPKETWLDWLPPGATEPGADELLTREELVARLRAAGEAIAPATFAYWQGRGVLPYPLRRRRAGATRALYPPWMTWVVRDLIALQRQGYPLAAIGPMLREGARRSYAPDGRTDVEAVADTEAYLARLSDLTAALAATARARERFMAGKHIVRAEVTFVTEDGAEGTDVHHIPPAAE